MFPARISVVMITRNRAGHIGKALQHLVELPEKPRIIVIDNGSSDETVRAARAFGAAVEVVALGRNLGGAGRNIGVELAGTPYVAFSDDDSWWAPGALALALQRFDATPQLGLLAARLLVGPDQHLDPICEIMARAGLPSDAADEALVCGKPIVGFVACGSIVRTTAFIEAGGFNVHFGVGGEEEVLAMDLMRRGWQLVYADDIVAHHHPSSDRDPGKRQRREVRNALWSAWMRRPLRSALASSWRITTRPVGVVSRTLGILDAVADLPWVLRARHPIPASIDRRVRIAESVFYSR
jgi:glycosyltransferase involved in cell wall biosynthesis